jgi:hypothetical protein
MHEQSRSRAGAVREIMAPMRSQHLIGRPARQMGKTLPGSASYISKLTFSNTHASRNIRRSATLRRLARKKTSKAQAT